MKTKLTLIALLIVLISVPKISNAYMFWNQACNFSGIPNSYLVIPNSATLNITGSFSIEMWVCPSNVLSPANQMLIEKTNAGGNGYNLFLKNGKVVIATNGSNILIGKAAIQNNEWTHISVSYDSGTDSAKIFLNSIKDTTAKIIGADPNPSVDSMRIGLSRHLPGIGKYTGYLDEIRVWSKAALRSEILNTYRMSLGGANDMLSLSLTFQNKNAAGALFSLNDWSGNNNNAINRGVTPLDQSNRPSNTIVQNASVNFDGSNYLTGTDNPDISPTTGITIEAWVYPLDTLTNPQILIHKGAPAGPANYGLRIVNGYFTAVLNGMEYSFDYDKTNAIKRNKPINIEGNTDMFPKGNSWALMAFTYDAAMQKAAFYCDGVLMFEETVAIGNILDGPDNLYIGGTPNGNKFTGNLDEVRISNYAKTSLEIANSKYISIDKSNEPNPSMKNVSYCFDGSFYDNCDNGPVLQWDSGLKWDWIYQPSPVLIYDDQLNFWFAKAFYLRNTQKRIPEIGNTGIFIDSLTEYLDATISDVEVFVTLAHANLQEIKVSLISPTGSVLVLADNLQGIDYDNELTTVFDDNADSSLNSNLVTFGPKIKPRNLMNPVLTGQNTAGLWKLKIEDMSGAGTGTLYGWGIRFNNGIQRLANLKLTDYIQGFYNPVSNIMIPDTVKVTFRSSISPYLVLCARSAKLNSLGIVNFITGPCNTCGISYFMVIDHRNSIETWSAAPVIFDNFTGALDWNGTTLATQTYGNNVIQVDNFPVRYAIPGGDVNQDETVDASDLSAVDNDASVSLSGYVPTDVTGDDFVDAGDVSICDNNASNIVSVIKP